MKVLRCLILAISLLKRSFGFCKVFLIYSKLFLWIWFGYRLNILAPNLLQCLKLFFLPTCLKSTFKIPSPKVILYIYRGEQLLYLVYIINVIRNYYKGLGVYNPSLLNSPHSTQNRGFNVKITPTKKCLKIMSRIVYIKA